MNEKFLELAEEKQQKILNAAMEVFSKNEYKQASTDVIASRAGVSKGLLFYYFHNKKELYLYVYEYVVDKIQEQVRTQDVLKEKDFFELLRRIGSNKAEIMRKNPYLLDFSMNAFYSQKESVSEDLKKKNIDLERRLFDKYFSHIDFYKFKADVKPFDVYQMLLWMADGYVHEYQLRKWELDVDALCVKFEEWMDMLRKLVYKEEYQK